MVRTHTAANNTSIKNTIRKGSLYKVDYAGFGTCYVWTDPWSNEPTSHLPLPEGATLLCVGQDRLTHLKQFICMYGIVELTHVFLKCLVPA